MNAHNLACNQMHSNFQTFQKKIHKVYTCYLLHLLSGFPVLLLTISTWEKWMLPSINLKWVMPKQLVRFMLIPFTRIMLVMFMRNMLEQFIRIMLVQFIRMSNNLCSTMLSQFIWIIFEGLITAEGSSARGIVETLWGGRGRTTISFAFPISKASKTV